ncbi:HemK2/MTQ2 family protein methyltransferase [Streptomyces bohaiensis]|uniref:Methyltransferase n=1 Tax=Streptomyces bohaiensis TaxID=1431344 RepID=A0ABX1CDG4_9ACTN|nr:HemK2/MTQ2 family protein methyltransferase [Streptomyces bohaiensis]NJQ16331.1 methyltransferase [Streptomyces bohaiensis]
MAHQDALRRPATDPDPPAPADRLFRLPGVYRPQADTLLLAAAMRREGFTPGTEVLDLCTGSGALALHAARLGARVTAVDISRRAVASARLNTAFARLPVSVRRGDLLSVLRGRAFDALVSNPPYVPAPTDAPSRLGGGRAWDAGPDGRLVLDRICDGAAAALRPGGLLLLVQSHLSGPEATVDRLAGAGIRAAVSDRVTVPFGPVLRGRARWLRAQGLLSHAVEGEDLVVIRGRKG